MITPETIVNDVSEALNTTDLVPDVNHNGKDYLSYRYRWNDTRELWMFVNKGDEKYSATYYAKSGRVSLGMVPLEFMARYMELVKEYFLPFVESHREGK